MQIAINIRKDTRLQDLVKIPDKQIDAITGADVRVSDTKLTLCQSMVERKITIDVQGKFRDTDGSYTEKEKAVKDYLTKLDMSYELVKDQPIPEPKASGMTSEEKELLKLVRSGEVTLEQVKEMLTEKVTE